MKKFNIAIYKNLLRTKKIGKNIIYLEKVDSTNNFAYKLIKNNKDKNLNGMIIIAETQEKGRGRLERTWLSPSGGLWFTIILKTILKEKKLPVVTLIAAYSITSVLDTEYNIKTIIKWPNDIYYKESKLAGILTELEKINNQNFLIIGIGINVNINIEKLAPFDKRSISIKAILGKDINREEMLSKILLGLEENYNYYSRTKDLNTIFKKIEKILSYNTK